MSSFHSTSLAAPIVHSDYPHEASSEPRGTRRAGEESGSKGEEETERQCCIFSQAWRDAVLDGESKKTTKRGEFDFLLDPYNRMLLVLRWDLSSQCYLIHHVCRTTERLLGYSCERLKGRSMEVLGDRSKATDTAVFDRLLLSLRKGPTPSVSGHQGQGGGRGGDTQRDGQETVPKQQQQQQQQYQEQQQAEEQEEGVIGMNTPGEAGTVHFSGYLNLYTAGGKAFSSFTTVDDIADGLALCKIQHASYLGYSHIPVARESFIERGTPPSRRPRAKRRSRAATPQPAAANTKEAATCEGVKSGERQESRISSAAVISLFPQKTGG